ncbi:hypothetical protein BC937DRAFT_95338 [Endogone sp. FLAS-F59071]|nr:hypothetical protein BC937DRAFT_95338 [Endogone sp. FLAS-F59071]|eukprot:RUS13438.1 hypothetical protein BC937DRAFT_95338 [Endogone sp. FLAS-F59071]
MDPDSLAAPIDTPSTPKELSESPAASPPHSQYPQTPFLNYHHLKSIQSHDSTYFGQHLSQSSSPSYESTTIPADLSDPSQSDQGLSYFKLQPSADQSHHQRKAIVSPYLAGAKKLADDVNLAEEEESKEEQEERKERKEVVVVEEEEEEEEEEEVKLRAQHPGVHHKPTEFEPDSEITAELRSLYTNFQRCLDLREKYLAYSCQFLFDSPKDRDDWEIYPPPPKPSWPPPPPEELERRKKKELLRERNPVEAVGSDFKFEDCKIPGVHQVRTVDVERMMEIWYRISVWRIDGGFGKMDNEPARCHKTCFDDS